MFGDMKGVEWRRKQRKMTICRYSLTCKYMFESGRAPDFVNPVPFLLLAVLTFVDISRWIATRKNPVKLSF